MTSARKLTAEIICYEDFLSREECRFVADELQTAYWKPSKVIQTTGSRVGDEIVSPSRTSETAYEQWFSKDLKEFVVCIAQRLSQLTGVRPNHLETWQATKYSLGGKFDYHVDAGYWKGHHAGDRMRTILLYLDTPRKGGGTHFRALDVHVAAKAGRLLIWQNLFENGACNYRLMHSGTPVLKGKKTTLVCWERQKMFDTTFSKTANRQV